MPMNENDRQNDRKNDRQDRPFERRDRRDRRDREQPESEWGRPEQGYQGC